MEQDRIDNLLERYLHLLHEYTTLRDELTALQTGMYQNIARANFAAERGLRYGRDHYDDRMQASRRLAISRKGQEPSEAQGLGQGQGQGQDRGGPGVVSQLIPNFAVVGPTSSSSATTEDSEEDSEDDGDARVPGSNPSPNAEPQSATRRSDDTRSTPMDSEADVEEEEVQPKDGTVKATIDEKSSGRPNKPRPNDPLRWFGLLTPVPLRQAQAQSIRAVEHVIPRLVSVDAEMAEVEIEVRRARKRRAKAEATASKLSQQEGTGVATDAVSCS